jgi:hypothetical protein
MSQRGLLLNCLKIENSLGKKTPLEQKIIAGRKRFSLIKPSMSQWGLLLRCLRIENSLGKKTPPEQKMIFTIRFSAE